MAAHQGQPHTRLPEARVGSCLLKPALSGSSPCGNETRAFSRHFSSCLPPSPARWGWSIAAVPTAPIGPPRSPRRTGAGRPVGGAGGPPSPRRPREASAGPRAAAEARDGAGAEQLAAVLGCAVVQGAGSQGSLGARTGKEIAKMLLSSILRVRHPG